MRAVIPQRTRFFSCLSPFSEVLSGISLSGLSGFTTLLLDGEGNKVVDCLEPLLCVNDIQTFFCFDRMIF